MAETTHELWAGHTGQKSWRDRLRNLMQLKYGERGSRTAENLLGASEEEQYMRYLQKKYGTEIPEDVETSRPISQAFRHPADIGGMDLALMVLSGGRAPFLSSAAAGTETTALLGDALGEYQEGNIAGAGIMGGLATLPYALRIASPLLKQKGIASLKAVDKRTPPTGDPGQSFRFGSERHFVWGRRNPFSLHLDEAQNPTLAKSRDWELEDYSPRGYPDAYLDSPAVGEGSPINQMFNNYLEPPGGIVGTFDVESAMKDALKLSYPTAEETAAVLKTNQPFLKRTKELLNSEGFDIKFYNDFPKKINSQEFKDLFTEAANINRQVLAKGLDDTEYIINKNATNAKELRDSFRIVPRTADEKFNILVGRALAGEGNPFGSSIEIDEISEKAFLEGIEKLKLKPYDTFPAYYHGVNVGPEAYVAIYKGPRYKLPDYENPLTKEELYDLVPNADDMKYGDTAAEGNPFVTEDGHTKPMFLDVLKQRMGRSKDLSPLRLID